MTPAVVIVGAGLAGYTLAREFRKLDADTPLIIICADRGHCYSKPLLSTGFAKNKHAEELATADAATMAEQLGARILTRTQVSAIDPAQRTLLAGDETIAYRDLILAVGAEPIRAPLEGDAADTILTLNDLEDYARLREQAAGKGHMTILGAGLIGCEIANDMASAGYQVELVAPSEQIMPTLLPADAAAALQAQLQTLSVRMHLGRVVSRLDRDGERMSATLSDGQRLETDLVLSAIGLRPRIELAQAAGLQVGRGIVVDRLLRSSDAHIYALGDCAEVEGLNLLYVMPLMTCARALAKTLAGTPTPVSYGAMPVTVKTPVCPVVVAPPPAAPEGNWRVQGEGSDIHAEYRCAKGSLLGYALTGAAVQNRLALTRELPALLP